jgi:hypothetical protein
MSYFQESGSSCYFQNLSALIWPLKFGEDDESGETMHELRSEKRLAITCDGSVKFCCRLVTELAISRSQTLMVLTNVVAHV